jgi:hypothetical protein
MDAEEMDYCAAILIQLAEVHVQWQTFWICNHNMLVVRGTLSK